MTGEFKPELKKEIQFIVDAIENMTDEQKQKFLAELTGNPDGKAGKGIPLSEAMKDWIEEADKECPDSDCKCKREKNV